MIVSSVTAAATAAAYLNNIANLSTSTSTFLGSSSAPWATSPASTNGLPVALKIPFPTLSPSINIPRWNLEPASDNLNESAGQKLVKPAFGFVVIDGPAGALADLSKEGSDYEFLNCPVTAGRQKVRLLCTNDTENSNCDDIYLDGVEGTIIKMPDGCGEGTYAVAHAFETSPDQSNTIRPHLKGAGPIMELDLSYNFSIVQKAKPNVTDIFIRIDYSNVPGHWDRRVDPSNIGSGKHSRIDRRFFSAKPPAWKPKFEPLSKDEQNSYTGTFSNPLYGEIKACADLDDSYMQMSVTGAVTGESRWGYSFVGTISPLKLEQAYGFFDNDIQMTSAKVQIQTFGEIQADEVRGIELSPPMFWKKPFSQPGLLHFGPSLHVGVVLKANIELDSDLFIELNSSTPAPISQRYPSSTGALGGTTNLVAKLIEGQNHSIQNSSEGSFRLSLLPTIKMRLSFADYVRNVKAQDVQHEISAFSETYVAIKASGSGCATVEVGVSGALVSLQSLKEPIKPWTKDSHQTKIIPGSRAQSQIFEQELCSSLPTERQDRRGNELFRRVVPSSEY